VDNLQELFLMSLSSKGERSLDAHKHLSNYLLALIHHSPETADPLLHFLQESNLTILLSRTSYLFGILSLLNHNNFSDALTKLEQWEPK
jgi:hypothetical protein